MIWVFWGALLGAALGSFWAASWWRFHNHMGIGGRSVCSFCGEELPGKLNIPLVSWLWLRGRSRCCDHPLDRQDFLYEVGGLLLGAAVGFLGGPLALLGLLLLVLLGAGALQLR